MRNLLYIGILSIAALPAHADLLTASVAPGRARAGAAVDTTLALSWRLTTDAAHDSGALSTGGEFLDAVTGLRLAVTGTTVGANTGAGILVYPETLTVSASQVAAWRAQGVRLLGYRRTFLSRTPPPQAAQLLITLTGTGLQAAREAATSGELGVLRMELAFSGGKRIAIVELGAKLAAHVTLAYSGSGTLRARWEVADPAGAAEPFFRVLAHVREPLAGQRQHTVESPPLPTGISGRYVLRFCLEGRGDAACESSDTAVQTLYEVTAGARVPALTGLAPDNAEVDAATPFDWSAVNGVTTYQLQIFRPGDPAPAFVAGMLLDSSITRTALSEVTRSKLTGGQRYLWRVTAHDADGRLLALAEPASFIYLPADAPAEARKTP
jgi:hypothetical protein